MGEFARKPGAPKIADTPLELLTPRPGEGFSLVDRYVYPVSAGLGGFFVGVLNNLASRRPPWAGIYVHVLCAAAGYFIGTVYRNSQFAARSENDAVYKHYISLHPEDFPPFEKKRFKDLFEPWKPMR